SNRQLYLVPQYFENKPVEHLLGEGITADMLNDDCLGRTLDWLYEHDVTTLFAGLALQARRRLGIAVQHLHIDTTSFSVSGNYASQEDGDPVAVAITYGYSRDHREDLKQWMLALATTHDGDIPIFLRPLGGNSSDKQDLSAAVREVMTQLREHQPEGQEQQIAVFDSGGYSEANMKSYNAAKIAWVSRVPETSTAAKKILEEAEKEQWQPLSDGSGDAVVHLMELPQGKERWVVVRTHAQLQATQEQMEKKVQKTQQGWEKRLWHLSKQSFACESDAQQAWKEAMKGKPSWLIATCTWKEQAQYLQRGRPKKEAAPDQTIWSLVPKLEVDQREVEVLVKKKAAFIVGTNLLETQRLSHEQVISTYKEQGGVERGFRFLKDPLFLASSIFVKKPERVIALSFVMVLCLLVYRLAEHLLRRQLAATQQTLPNQVNKPTSRPTMRWIFQCFEGIDLLHICIASRWQTQVLGLQPLHQQVLRLLGPAYSQFYFFSP
ncbi:MAG: IS1634 family transposase, partial [Chloroflexota bacterium]|nr:IS1634 family transposase [Chloroflexota bacterium]